MTNDAYTKYLRDGNTLGYISKTGEELFIETHIWIGLRVGASIIPTVAGKYRVVNPAGAMADFGDKLEDFAIPITQDRFIIDKKKREATYFSGEACGFPVQLIF